jgi:SIR2-like domain
LFLGYSLGDWNFRLLLHRLRENQLGSDTKHWACLLSDDPVEAMFWQKRGVNIHYVSLDRFLEDLKRKLTGS